MSRKRPWVGSVEQYQYALRDLHQRGAIPEKVLKMLKEHAEAPLGRLTIFELYAAREEKKAHPDEERIGIVNQQYGLFADAVRHEADLPEGKPLRKVDPNRAFNRTSTIAEWNEVNKTWTLHEPFREALFRNGLGEQPTRPQQTPREKEPEPSDGNDRPPSSSPPLGSDRSASEVDPTRAADAYVFRILDGDPKETKVGKTRAFKIGCAYEAPKRMALFNQYALPRLGGVEYRPFKCQRWTTGTAAREMEQILLKAFGKRYHGQNGEVAVNIGADEMRRAWHSALEACQSKGHIPIGDEDVN